LSAGYKPGPQFIFKEPHEKVFQERESLMLDINGIGIKTTEDLLEAIKKGSSGDIHEIYFALRSRYGHEKALEEIEAVIYNLLGKKWQSKENRPFGFCYECQQSFQTRESWHQHCNSGTCF
jgi:hypothetical protein